MSDKRVNNNKKENRFIWMIVALILLGIIATGIILGEALSRRSASDKNAIGLIQEESSSGSGSNKDKDGNSKDKSDKETNDEMSSGEDAFVPYLDVELSDEDGVWTTNTQVSIFEMSYENGNAVVTVEGNGDSVIAPGTENTYTFYLKNNGNTAIDYNLALTSFFTPFDQMIPVKVRLKGYDGSYLLGGEDKWEDVEKLNEVSEWVTIGVNCYAYYTLEWMWPFESDNDVYDTYLGDMSVDETLELTVNIQTVSTVSTNMNAQGGIPQTGDTMNIIFYGSLFAGSVAALVIIFFIWKRKKEDDEETSEE